MLQIGTYSLHDADALIIVPPFGGIDRPSLGAHILSACALTAGKDVCILYANVLFAAEIGELPYQAICYAPTSFLLGERIFAAAAYAVPPLGRGELVDEEDYAHSEDQPELKVDVAKLQEIEAGVEAWLDQVTEYIMHWRFRVIGCTTTFEQTAASIALLQRVKMQRPEVLTILGGANCENEMAKGICSLTDAIDYVFSGESETTFTQFLHQVQDADLPKERIITGIPCMHLDEVPTPDYTEFYEQFNQFLPKSMLKASESIWLPYESSRGCWWGEKHHCTFCGINGQTLTFRSKSPDRVIAELKQLVSSHPTNRVCMVDNIMPHQYFKTLLPRLGTEVPNLHLFYEQKANLTLGQVQALHEAGVATVQPGIESLSTNLLRLMDKGVSARQNLALLRYARAVGLNLNWNLLYAFPGDRAEDYEAMLAIIPLLYHLQPPGGPYHLSIDRFSPYFNTPEKYGIRELRPLDSYYTILPDEAAVEQVAYHFLSDYQSGSKENTELMMELSRSIQDWREAWKSNEKAPPVLSLTALAEDIFLLMDTRGLPGTEQFRFLDREQARLALLGGRHPADSEMAWAVDAGLVVELDARLVPLATAAPHLLRAFETEHHLLVRSSSSPSCP